MSGFLAFCRLHGVIIDALPTPGVWRRYPTEDKPKKKNAAVLWKSEQEGGFVKNWAVHEKAIHWKDETARPPTDAERAATRARAKAAQETQEKGWGRAAERAEKMLATCRPGNHGYAHRKGFATTPVLVTPEGAMFVPMRHFHSNKLMGAQLIRWLVEEREWEKKFFPGQRSAGAVFRMGNKGRETVLVEGWATGMSVEAALREMRLSTAVLVCFSAFNLTGVARLVDGKGMVFADNDASGAGRKAAEDSGLPWVMSPVVGEDANDLHVRAGLRELAGMLLDLRRKS